VSRLERSELEAQRDSTEFHRTQAVLQRRSAPRFFICDRNGEIVFCSPDLVDTALLENSYRVVERFLRDERAGEQTRCEVLDARHMLRIIPLSGPRAGFFAVFFEMISSRNSLEFAAQRFDLTKRELQVLELLGSGCSTAEIARQLFISEGTVGDHVKNLFRKTNTNRRSVLLARIYREDSLGRSGIQ
jgi:DNA-binding CsgD family transcriptional regulator